MRHCKLSQCFILGRGLAKEGEACMPQIAITNSF